MKKNQNIKNDAISLFIKSPSDETMMALVNYAKATQLSDDQIALLAISLAESGLKLSVASPVYDIPSTGGPSSLTTLICPLVLDVLGKKVIKLGVPGRPAGGIDVLAQLKGYNYSPTLQQIRKWSNDGDYIHFIASEHFVPLDARLFEFRKKHSAVNVPSLAIASLLSKKIAVGLTNVGLDVRVWDGGNFGTTNNEARANSHRFIQISKTIGIQSTCFLSDLSYPQQPYIGRGESLLALYNIFENKAPEWLSTHLTTCIAMAIELTRVPRTAFTIRDIATSFYKNIQIQGSSATWFKSYVDAITNDHINVIRSLKSGFLKIDLYRLREAIVSVQTQIPGRFPDNCGVILKHQTGDFIFDNEVICTFRCTPKYVDAFRSLLETAFEMTEQPQSKTSFEIINSHGKI